MHPKGYFLVITVGLKFLCRPDERILWYLNNKGERTGYPWKVLSSIIGTINSYCNLNLANLGVTKEPPELCLF